MSRASVIDLPNLSAVSAVMLGVDAAPSPLLPPSTTSFLLGTSNIFLSVLSCASPSSLESSPLLLALLSSSSDLEASFEISFSFPSS